MTLYIGAAADTRDWSGGCEAGHQSCLLQILQQKDKNKEILKRKLLWTFMTVSLGARIHAFLLGIHMPGLWEMSIFFFNF